MTKRTFMRIAAFIMAALLLPVYSAAQDEYYEFEAPYQDMHSDHAGSVTLYEYKGKGYYISAESAADMLGFNWDGESFTGQNGVKVKPYIEYVPSETVNGKKIYDLNALMNRLNTFVSASYDGKMLYNSVPVNLDSLLCETERVMKDSAYNADLLENMGGKWLVQSFAWAYNIVWNLRINIGKAYKDDYKDMLLRVLGPCGSEKTIGELVKSGAKYTEKAIDLTLKGQSAYDDFYAGLELPIPGDGYLLFGQDGTGPLRECAEAVKQAEDYYKFSASDFMGVVNKLYAVKKVNALYADAYKEVNNAVRFGGKIWRSMQKEPAYTMGSDVLRSYDKYNNDFENYLIKDGIKLLGEEWIAKQATDAMTEHVVLTTPAKLVKTGINLIDPYLLKVNKKNDAMKNVTILADIQDYFSYAYSRAQQSTDMADRANVSRAAALLYLKCVWLSFDSVEFDKSLSGAVKRMKENIEGRMSVIASFPDSSFNVSQPTSIPEGALTMNAEKTADEDGVMYRDKYVEFVNSYAWMDDSGLPDYYDGDIKIAYPDGFEGYGLGDYCFADINKDGVSDLIIFAYTCGANGSVMLYTCDGENIISLGHIKCGGFSAGIHVHEGRTGFLLSQYHGGIATYVFCDIVDGSLAEAGPDIMVNDDDPNAITPDYEGWELIEQTYPIGK